MLIDQEHGSQVLVIDLLLVEFVFAFILFVLLQGDWHSERVTLSVEGVHLIVVRVVEALLREVFAVAIHHNLCVVQNLLFCDFIEEMVMSQCSIVEEVHVQQVVLDEHTGDEWIWEVVDWHRVVVQAKSIVDVELIGQDLLLCSFLDVGILVDSEDPELKHAVIKIWHREFVTVVILLNLLHLDVAGGEPSNFLLKLKDVALQREELDDVQPVVRHLDCDGVLRVIGDGAADDGVVGQNILGPCQP